MFLHCVYILAFFHFSAGMHSSHFFANEYMDGHCGIAECIYVALLFARYAMHLNNVMPVVCVHSCSGDECLTKQVVSYLIQKSLASKNSKSTSN